MVGLEDSARLVLRIALAGGVTWAGWFLDGEEATEPQLAAQA